MIWPENLILVTDQLTVETKCLNRIIGDGCELLAGAQGLFVMRAQDLGFIIQQATQQAGRFGSIARPCHC